MGQRGGGATGLLAAVGSSAEVQKLVTPATRVVDAHGAMLVPGFIDRTCISSTADSI